MVKDHQRAEDVTQEVFVSALRRMRATERPIAFKPWVYEIAKNACIDQFRRSKRAEEVSFDADEGLAPSDYGRLVSPEPVPDAAFAAKQQLDHMVGAFGGLSEAHHQILVLRELEGLSYREIGERMGMSRPAVESTLFRARRRLSEEYDELASGERCLRVQSIIATAVERPPRRARHAPPGAPRRPLPAVPPPGARRRRGHARWSPAGRCASARSRRSPRCSRSRCCWAAAAAAPATRWTSQLPLLSDHAAAGGAKLAAVAAIVVAGLGAGVGTQVAQRDDGADRPARAIERVTPRAVSSATAPLSAAVAASRSAHEPRRRRATRARATEDAGDRVGTATAPARRRGHAPRRHGSRPPARGGGSVDPGPPGRGAGLRARRRPARRRRPDAPSAPTTETPRTRRAAQGRSCRR